MTTTAILTVILILLAIAVGVLSARSRDLRREVERIRQDRSQLQETIRSIEEQKRSIEEQNRALETALRVARVENRSGHPIRIELPSQVLDALDSLDTAALTRVVEELQNLNDYFTDNIVSEEIIFKEEIFESDPGEGSSWSGGTMRETQNTSNKEFSIGFGNKSLKDAGLVDRTESSTEGWNSETRTYKYTLRREPAPDAMCSFLLEVDDGNVDAKLKSLLQSTNGNAKGS